MLDYYPTRHGTTATKKPRPRREIGAQGLLSRIVGMSGRRDSNPRPHVPHSGDRWHPACGWGAFQIFTQVLPKAGLIAGVIAVLLAPALAPAQPARTFEVLSGSTHPDSLEAGTMLTLTEWRISESDTLRVWAERTTHSVGPSRHEAKGADRVAWCYPGRYPDERHLFPSAEVLLSFGARQEGDNLIMFVTESAYERHYAGDLGWKPLALH